MLSELKVDFKLTHVYFFVCSMKSLSSLFFSSKKMFFRFIVNRCFYYLKERKTSVRKHQEVCQCLFTLCLIPIRQLRLQAAVNQTQTCAVSYKPCSDSLSLAVVLRGKNPTSIQTDQSDICRFTCCLMCCS